MRRRLPIAFRRSNVRLRNQAIAVAARSHWHLSRDAGGGCSGNAARGVGELVQRAHDSCRIRIGSRWKRKSS